MGNVFISIFTLLLSFTSIGLFRSNLTFKESLDNASYEYSDDYGFLYKEAKGTIGGVKQAIFYGEYKSSPDSEYEWVIHSIRSGSTTTRTNVLNIAKDYETKTNRKVIFATNGDYFDLNTGTNIESYVNEGIVINKGAFITKHCIGFDNDKKVVVGRMTDVEKRLMLKLNDETTLYEIDKFNEEPSDGEIAVYNVAGTYSLNNCGRYIISSSSANLNQCPVWGESKRMSMGDKTSSSSLTLKSGQFAIVLKDGELNDYFYKNIVYGVEVNLVEVPSGEYEGCTWVLGGYDILVNNFNVNTSCHTDNSGNAAAPRTFIGFKEDNTGFLCVVDGRQSSYSVGITVNEEAKLASSLGAKYALELDGGGSSTVVLRLNDELEVRNSPSDGSLRGVSNAIMLVEKVKEEQPSGGDDNPPVITTNPVVTNPPVVTTQKEITTTKEATTTIDNTTTTATPKEEPKKEGCSAFITSSITIIPLLLFGIIYINDKKKGDGRL